MKSNSMLCIILLIISILGNVLFLFLLVMSERSSHPIEQALDRHGIIKMDEKHRSDYWICKGWENSISQLNLRFDIVFLGNSLTYGGNFQEYFPGVKLCNLGVSGSTLCDMRRRIPLLKAAKPRKLFLMAGANDLLVSSIDQYIDEYTKLITEIRKTLPNIQIYVQTILPMNSDAGPKRIAPDVIIEANDRLSILSSELNVTFVDLYTRYNQNDSLPKEFSKDGLHLNQEAYSVWAETIYEFIQN